MKTRIMATRVMPDGLRDDLKLFDSISREQIDTITEILAKLEDFVDLNDDQARLEFSKKTGLSADKFVPVIRAFSYIRTILEQYNDGLDEYVDDLLSENIISESDGEKIRAGLKKLSGKPIWQPHFRSDMSYGQVFPVFDHMNTRCILSPSFDKEYTAKDIPDVYSAKVSVLLPATILSIAATGPDETTHFNFVVTESDMDKFINQLQLAKKQLAILKSHVKA